MLQVLWDVGRLVQHANDVDVIRMGKVKNRIGEMVQSPEPERRFHIGYCVAHGAGGWMPFDVIERWVNKTMRFTWLLRCAQLQCAPSILHVTHPRNEGLAQSPVLPESVS